MKAKPGGGSPELRAQLGILKDFMEGLDFVRMAPDDAVIQNVSPELSARALVERGRAYAVYLHVPLPHKPEEIARHRRENVEARLDLELSAGRYRAEWVDTKTGQVERAETLEHGGGSAGLVSPPFADDIALRVIAVE